MSLAGELDLERPGINRSAVPSYTYNPDGTLNTIVYTYNNGTAIVTYTKTASYNGSLQLIGFSAWVKS